MSTRSLICLLVFFWGGLALDTPSHARMLTLTTVDESLDSVVVERVLREAYQRLGIELIVERLPARRALRMAATGMSDGELGRVAGLEFENEGLILVPVQLGMVEGLVFTTLAPFPVEGWSSLLPYRVGIQRGIWVMEKGTSSMESILVSSVTQLFRLLAAGRVDVIVVPNLVGLKSFRAADFPGVRQLEPPLFSHGLYHYLHRKNRDLVPGITEALRSMRAEGRIQQILGEYINECAPSGAAPPMMAPLKPGTPDTP